MYLALSLFEIDMPRSAEISTLDGIVTTNMLGAIEVQVKRNKLCTEWLFEFQACEVLRTAQAV